jgi:hypothetical protein
MEELSQDFTSQLSSIQQQVKAANAALVPSVTESLKSDDRVLVRLESLMADWACSEGTDGNIGVKSEKLSRKYGQRLSLMSIGGDANSINVDLLSSTRS